MDIQAVTQKIDALTGKLEGFADEQKSIAKIKELEMKFSNLQTAMFRPEAVGITEDIEQKNAFNHYLRTGDVRDLETKSLYGAADAEGGFLITPALYHRIITGMNAKSPMRRLASIETISTSSLDVIIEDGNFDSGWVADAQERAETKTPKLKQKKIMVHELYAQPKASQRLVDDTALNLDEWLNDKLQDSFVRSENVSFIRGDGNNQPFGITYYGEDTIERVEAEEAQKITPNDILNLINALGDDYLGNASLLMHRSTLSSIQKLQDNNGRFLWQPALSEAHPETLCGIPVVCSSDMPVIAEDALAIAIADFKAAYKIVDRSGIVMMRDPYTEKPFIKFYTVKRVGGDVVNDRAIKFLKV